MLVAIVFAALTAAAPAASPPGAPTLRLPATVRPLAGSLELRVDLEEEGHSGTARYRVSVTEPSPILWMHAEGLTVTSATVGGRPARAIAAPGGFLGLQPDGPIPAATAREACDPDRRAAVESFLGPRVSALEGAPQSLRVGLEEADACIAARARNGEAISKFLRRR
jgi:hypothetical protein